MSKSPWSILVVDDQPEIRKVLRRLFERDRRYVIAEAADGAEAVSVAKAGPPDAVLLDIAMPGTSGITAIRRLREVAPGAKIVVLSGHYDMSDEMLALGADAFLPKTTPAKELLKTLESLLTS